MKILLIVSMLVVLFAETMSGQVRPVEEKAEPETAARAVVPEELPESIETHYQGGFFGFSKKAKGTIKFDTLNERLVFYGEDEKEKFSIPYQSMLVVYASQQKVTSGTGRVVSAIPFPGAGIGGLFMKKKKNYLVIQFDDPDVDAKGAVNFLMDTSEILFTSVHAVGQNAEMYQRGDAYIRKRSN